MAVNSTKAQDEDAPELDLSRARVVRRGLKHPLGPRLSLGALREAVGKTQTEVAERAEMAQGDISRLERREDAKVSTLRRYVEALGGQLELVVVLDSGHRMRIEL